MAPRGPKRRPTERIDGFIPEPPKSLTGEALAAWQQLAPVIAERVQLRSVDAVALADLCLCAVRVQQAENIISKEGVTLTGYRHEPRKHPAVAIARAYRADLQRWLSAFRMTPTSRGRVAQVSGEPLDLIESARQRLREQ